MAARTTRILTIKTYLILGTIIIAGLGGIKGTPRVLANNYAKPVYKVGTYQPTDDTVFNSKDYQDTTGLYLMINVNGVDSRHNTLVLPQYQDIKLDYNKTYTKDELLRFVQNVIDASMENFKVIDLHEVKLVRTATQEEMSPNTFSTLAENQYNDANQSYLLTGNVLVEPVSKRNLKEVIKTDKAGKPIKDSDAVAITQYVNFVKKEKGRLTSVSFDNHFNKEGLTGLRYYDSKVSSDELFEAAKRIFETTKEAKEGYKILKRISTSVTQDPNIPDGTSHRLVYHIDQDRDFHYVVDSNRLAQATPSNYTPEDPTTYAPHHDHINETYFISKDDTDDYAINPTPITIYQQNKQQQLIQEYNFRTFEYDTTEEIRNYLTKADFVQSFYAKDGKYYQFTGELIPISKTEFIARYNESNK